MREELEEFITKYWYENNIQVASFPVMKKIEELFLKTMGGIIGKDEHLHANEHGILPDEGIKNLIRNELRAEQKKRLLDAVSGREAISPERKK